MVRQRRAGCAPAPKDEQFWAGSERGQLPSEHLELQARAFGRRKSQVTGS